MNVFELLKNDHEKVSRIFKQLEAAPASDSSSRRQLFVQLKQELDLHAHAEETIFTPC
ncbi:MAG TPA: hemerythrin domain-containing protein [Pyrinomonadaceae bacterium]|nr:hemerythrin domain-containing protein [Pyrinomonadaceae bacterium]